MGQAPSFGDKPAFGERFTVSFRSRTPKPDAQKPAAVGLFGGVENGGESLVPSGLERAKGFEPSTPTLARLCSGRVTVECMRRMHVELHREALDDEVLVGERSSKLDFVLDADVLVGRQCQHASRCLK